MKNKIILFMTFSIACAQDIEIVDDQGNADKYPAEFLKQSEYFKGIIEDAQYQPPLHIPVNISLSEMHELYMDSLTDFKTSSLQQLTDYFVDANKLLNHDLQQQLVQLIIERIALGKNTDKDIKYAKNTLQKILALDSYTIDESIIIKKNDKPLKQLDSSSFQEYFNAGARSTYMPLGANEQIVASLMLFYKGWASPVSMQTGQEQEIQSNIQMIKDIFRQEININFVLKGPYLDFSTPFSTTFLEEVFNIPAKTIDWENTSVISGNANGKKAAFATPKYIVITPNGETFYGKGNKFQVGFIVYKLIGKKYLLPNARLLPLKDPEIPCTHVAFSFTNNSISYTKDNKCFLINTNDKTIRPIPFSAPVFSSLLIDNDKYQLLLVRTVNGNTFALNLQNNKVFYLPDFNVDYFTVAYQKEDGTFEVRGFTEIDRGIINTTDILNLNNLK